MAEAPSEISLAPPYRLLAGFSLFFALLEVKTQDENTRKTTQKHAKKAKKNALLFKKGRSFFKKALLKKKENVP